MSEPSAAIERVVRDYLEGMNHGNPSQIEAAMHPKCMQAGHFNGVYEFFDRAEFIAALQAEDPAPPGTPIDSEILSVDITGDVALVKLRDACFGTTFTDYLTLIRHEGRWQIVMKAFYDHANDG